MLLLQVQVYKLLILVLILMQVLLQLMVWVQILVPQVLKIHRLLVLLSLFVSSVFGKLKIVKAIK
jgi:hypothetical protein